MPARHPRHDASAAPRSEGELPRTVIVLPDQLHVDLGALRHAREQHGARCGVVLVESAAWLSRRPYHRQRLAMILIAMRHFAFELEQAGIEVERIETESPLAAAIADLARDRGRLVITEPAEREVRVALEPLARSGLLSIVEHDGWLTTPAEFHAACPRAPYRMDAFYRHVRRTHDLLMDEDGKPVGGRLSFDVDNRKPWRGDPPAPEPPRFGIDPIKEAVGARIASRFAAHPGELDLTAIPGAIDDVNALWSWAKMKCLAHFGPFEDAMSVRSRGLFHTRISALVNLHRLLPQRVLRDVIELDLPLPSKEGFVRQLVGWREFVRHVHRETDGFRAVAGARPVATSPGDGGFARWSGGAWTTMSDDAGIDGGACPDALDAELPLPPAYWGARSGLACLDRVVADVWAEGWSHHITRLMVLSNIATLLGVSPRELTDWFWIAYIDSWDWVVEPNVLGMGTFALGELMTTKPYVSGSGYIDRMSDHCGSCAFDPKRTCPLTRLYWAFLARHAARFDAHPRMAARMGVVLKALARRAASERRTDERTFLHVREVLVDGRRLDATAPDGTAPLFSG